MIEVTGSLDLPKSGDEVFPGGTVRVCGWTLFDGAPPDRVEIWLGDGEAHPVRRGLPREDVLAEVPPHAPKSIACGFDSLAPVPLALSGQTVPLQVRAWSSGGHTWISDSIEVKVVSDVPAKKPLTTSDLSVPAATPRHDGPLRLMVFTHSLAVGGGELYLDELLGRLADGYDVEILLVAPAPGPLMESTRARSIAVHITNGYSADPDQYEGRIHEFQSLIASWQPDVVIANTVGIFPPVDAALRMEVPVIWAIHESFTLEHFITIVWGSRGLSPEIEARMRYALTEAHTVFVAQSTLQLYAEQLPDMRARHLHYGIDLSVISQFREDHSRTALRASAGLRDEDTVLLCMGLIQDRKAQLALVLAFSEMAALFPDAHLVLVGGQKLDYSLSVEESVATLGLDERVHVVPVQRETYPWYGMADVLVSASDVESLPRSILEAKAFGVPTLATDVFGLAEIITDGVNGWLCRPHSGNALTAGLFRVLSATSETLERMSQACLVESRRFDGSNYAQAYYEFASSLAASRNALLPQSPHGVDA